MKKVVYLVLILLAMCLTSCVKDKTGEVKVIAPSGTPALGLSNFFAERSEIVKYEIVAGSDPLIAAFTSKSHDIIVAPVNLGARFYNLDGSYILYKTFVFGNTYLTSVDEISSLTDLEGKEILAFGESSTPGIVLKALLSYNNIEANVTYTTDVATTNAALIAGKAKIILTAEPSLSNLKTKMNLFTIDLQKEWMKMTGSFSYPQAGIFVKKSYKNNLNVKNALNRMIESVKETGSDRDITSKNACLVDKALEKLGPSVLYDAIPNCHFDLLESDKESTEFYFNKLKEMGLAKMYGGVLPDEGFYAN